MAWKIIVIPQKNYAQGGGITLCAKLTKTSLCSQGEEHNLLSKASKARSQSPAPGIGAVEDLALESNALLEPTIQTSAAEKLHRKKQHLIAGSSSSRGEWAKAQKRTLLWLWLTYSSNTKGRMQLESNMEKKTIQTPPSVPNSLC